MKRLLITGAAGNIGRVARARLGHLAESLRLSDVVAMAAPGAGEETVVCDLRDLAAVSRLVEGCDGIVHLGGQSGERGFDDILQANIVGTYNLYEAVRRSGGRPRILFASSNHVIGFHPREARLDADSPPRPDGLYGVSKSYGESLARLYWEKFGIESAIVRIGSCFPEPRDLRQLATWLSFDDFISLVECVFRVQRLGCPIIYGASANDESWWDNSKVAWLGWRPKDNAERYRAALTASAPPQDPDSIAVRFQGGSFAAMGHYEDGE